MLRTSLVGASAVLVVAVLTACDQIPSFNPSDQAANKTACDSISQSWNSVSSALATANFMTIAQAVQGVPAQVDTSLKGATDKQLSEAMNSLKTQAQSIIGGAQPDVAALASTGVAISARCAILGSTASIQLPKF